MESSKTAFNEKNQNIVFNPISAKLDPGGKVKTIRKFSRATVAYVPENLDQQSEASANINKTLTNNYNYPDIPLVQINELNLHEIRERKLAPKGLLGSEDNDDIIYGDGELSKVSRSLEQSVDEFHQTFIALSEKVMNIENYSIMCEHLANLNRVQCDYYKNQLKEK